MVGAACPLAAEFRGQRLAANGNVFLNVARVVRHHNQAHTNNLGHGPQQHEPVQIARERLVTRERNKAAHNAAAHGLANGQVGNGRFACGIHHHEHSAHNANRQRNPASLPNNVGAQQKRRYQKPNAQAQRARGIHVVVHERGIAHFNVVVGRVGTFYEVVVVVERVHRGLHKNANREQHARHDRRNRVSRGRRGARRDERGQNRCRPGVRSGQLHGHFHGELLVFRFGSAFHGLFFRGLVSSSCARFARRRVRCR